MKLIVFIYGLLIGSFLNVLIYRIPRNENIAFPASHCPNCNTKLKWYDNIPLFSYIFLRGRCRYCNDKISLQYPIIEFLNGLLYLIMLNHYGLSIDFIFYSLIGSVLIAITIIDLKEMIIPDSLVLSILALSIIQKTINYYVHSIPMDIKESILGLLIAGGLFLLIVILSKGGMGGGDVTLIGALGFVLGIKLVMLNILLSFVIGAIISIFLLASKLKTKKDPIPFGPFIILSYFLVLLYGQDIIGWYFNIFL
ncbi:MAG: prepilin peptidase [Tissierellaceae bacterium]|nr:prepilin peptidase [Tissierellaceae bacterium]